MQNYKVFYSWQTDLPNATNRSFIEKALENAAKSIRINKSIKVEPVIDRDTAGVPGSPDIANTIFDKIENSQVFVCDVSIINKHPKFRSSPNPNVLIELGYAIKTLGEPRILMVMNTAFGAPELLPFDLNKKRILSYDMPEQCENRTTERKALESKLESALRTIFTETDKQAPTKHTKKSLQKKCSELIEKDDIAAWRQLIKSITDEIIENLLAWKQTGEEGISQLRTGLPNWEPWKMAVLEAVNISVPGLVPILTAIQADKENYWQDSTSFLRRLMLTHRDMGAGAKKVIEIGESILYVAGSIGMALASRMKQLNFVRLWADLALPEAEGPGQTTWSQIPEINYWQTGVTGQNNDPYGFVVQLLELDDIRFFFDNPEVFKQSLFSGNLLHSSVEFHHRASEPDYDEKISRQHWSPNVLPTWCLMEPNDFKSEACRIFGSSEEVINFAYPGLTPTEDKFWPLWQAWKKRCAQFMSEGGHHHAHLQNIYSLNLPGEPPIER